MTCVVSIYSCMFPGDAELVTIKYHSFSCRVFLICFHIVSMSITVTSCTAEPHPFHMELERGATDHAGRALVFVGRQGPTWCRVWAV